MIPTRGRARLLEERAVAAMRDLLLPRAALVTVNAPEAEVLTGSRVTRLDEARAAARALVEGGARAVLVKGGHLGGARAVDVFATKGRVVELAAKRLRLTGVHGGGCTLASLVAGRIAAEDVSIEDAVRWAKRVHHAALARAADAGGELRVLVP
jgi:hydroxymethylpyrimidine/phosphomethylpyrimidine kinase